MKEQVSLWAVYVRRTEEATVLVKTRDPEEAARNGNPAPLVRRAATTHAGWIVKKP